MSWKSKVIVILKLTGVGRPNESYTIRLGEKRCNSLKKNKTFTKLIILQNKILLCNIMNPPPIKDSLDYIKDLEQAKEIIRKLTEKLKDYKAELEEIKKLFVN